MDIYGNESRTLRARVLQYKERSILCVRQRVRVGVRVLFEQS